MRYCAVFFLLAVASSSATSASPELAAVSSPTRHLCDLASTETARGLSILSRFDRVVTRSGLRVANFLWRSELPVTNSPMFIVALNWVCDSGPFDLSQLTCFGSEESSWARKSPNSTDEFGAYCFGGTTRLAPWTSGGSATFEAVKSACTTLYCCSPSGRYQNMIRPFSLIFAPRPT